MPSTIGSSREHTATALRVIAAAAIVISGLVHLQLYFDGYRYFPNANLGRSFVLNALASVAVGCALVARSHVLVRLAGIAVAGGTLVAFAISRTEFGIFGLTERGLEPSPQAALALVTELVAIAALAATLLPAVGGGRNVQLAVAAPVALAVVAGTAIGAALWARSPEPATDATPAETGTELDDEMNDAPSDAVEITIEGFAFGPGDVTVPAGTTVTWTNHDVPRHTVTADEDMFGSGRLPNGESFTVELTEPGTFDYHCSIHPSMRATITVEE